MIISFGALALLAIRVEFTESSISTSEPLFIGRYLEESNEANANLSVVSNNGESSGGAGDATDRTDGENEAGGGGKDNEEGHESEVGESEDGEKTAGEEEEVEETTDKASIAGAVLLGTCIAIAMVVMGLTNSRREAIRSNTWKLLNAVLSVFLAVLYYSAVGVIFDEVFGPEELDSSDSVARVFAALAQLCLWIAIVFKLNVVMARRGLAGKAPVIAANLVLAHVASFSATEFLNSMMHAEPFDENAALASVTVIILFVSLLLLGVAVKSFQVCLVPEESREEVLDAMTEMYIDIQSVSVGFAILQIVRFLIIGELPSSDLLESKHVDDTIHSVTLIACAVFFAVLAVAILKMQAMLDSDRIAIELIRNISVLASAWFWIYWGDMQIVTLTDSKFMGLILQSMIYSAGVVLCLVSLEAVLFLVPSWKTAEKSINLLMMGCSWVVALPWEQTFDIGSEALSESTDTSHSFVRVITSLLMIAIVTPSWYFYIVPKAAEDNETPVERIEVEA